MVRVSLAAVCIILLSRQIHARDLGLEASQILYFLHLAVAIGFITVAIPIRLDAHWITIGWFVEAGVLLWVGNRIQSDFLNAVALGALVLGVGRLLVIDDFRTTQLVFNMRMATYTVAVAVLGAVAWFASQRADGAATMVAKVAVVALNILALIALSREVADYYARQVAVIHPVKTYPWRAAYTEIHRIDIARDFTYSALWMAYGAMLMVVGFVRRSAFVRWQALILIAVTIGKVSIRRSELDRGYRIVSFIVLGVLLLAISFVYQRDWLQLSAKSKSHPTTGGNADSV